MSRENIEIFYIERIIMDTIGKRIKYARSKISMSQEVLAERVGLKQGTISDIERDKSNPSIDTLIRIRDVLDVSIDWLLTGEDNNISLENDTKKILDMYKSLNEKDKNKIEGIMEEKLKTPAEHLIRNRIPHR